MPPKRNRRPPRQQQLQEQSDYDSETLHTDTTPAPAAAPELAVHPPPVRTNEELNLTVLKRHNPQIQQVLSVAPFAVVYMFSSTTQEWVKTLVEGTLFVCQLIPAVVYHGEEALVVERYSVMILNRKGLENFNTELHTSADVDITDEYVILQVDRKGQDEETAIYGLWIFSEPGTSTEHTRVVNAKVMMECASRSEKSREAANTATLDEEKFHRDGESEHHGGQGQHNGHDHGYGHEEQPQHHDHGYHGYDHGSHVQQTRGHEGGQQTNHQMDLLGLFGQSAVQAQAPHYDGYGPPINNGHARQQPHGGPQPGYLPHAHPQQMQQHMPQQMQQQMQQQIPQRMQQPTQAQNLLSLFKR